MSLWKTAFGGIPSLETNLGGIDCWMFAPIKSKKMSAELAKISAELPEISAELPGLSRTQLWLQISTTHENPIAAE